MHAFRARAVPFRWSSSTTTPCQTLPPAPVPGLQLLELEDWAAEALGADSCVTFSNDPNDYFKRMDL